MFMLSPHFMVRFLTAKMRAMITSHERQDFLFECFALQDGQESKSLCALGSLAVQTTLELVL